jgi:hypothetical protein
MAENKGYPPLGGIGRLASETPDDQFPVFSASRFSLAASRSSALG